MEIFTCAVQFVNATFHVKALSIFWLWVSGKKCKCDIRKMEIIIGKRNSSSIASPFTY